MGEKRFPAYWLCFGAAFFCVVFGSALNVFYVLAALAILLFVWFASEERASGSEKGSNTVTIDHP